MSITTYWSPNQAPIAQVETYTFSAPNAIGNTYTATINGKSVTYTSISGDTAATAATGLFNLLNVSTSIAPELTEITFANATAGQMTATAKVPGVPFANVPGTTAGLVMSTGGGLSNGITTAHTTANASPSDVNDAQNWLRVNLSVGVPTKTRALPQNNDDVVVGDSNVPMLWGLDQLASVQFNTYTRWQSMTGQIGLPENNPNGYTEWRAQDFKFSGPQGSVPAGGLQMVCGYSDGTGSGPAYESYDVMSQLVTLTCLGGGTIRFRGLHTQNSFVLNGGVDLEIAMRAGEKANLNTSTVNGGTLGIGPNVTWTSGSTLTMNGGTAILNSAPTTTALNNGAVITVATDQLTWGTITAQGGSSQVWLAGGTITTLTMSEGATLDKSGDSRGLTITNSTMDGDTCVINDPLNAITFTNATSVKQQVSNGPIRFTGTRTVKVT